MVLNINNKNNGGVLVSIKDKTNLNSDSRFCHLCVTRVLFVKTLPTGQEKIEGG